MHLDYRPDKLEYIIGNDHIKRFLNNTYEYTKHILFEGERGTGKTTLAYIVANKFGAPKENIFDINCQHVSGVSDMRETVERFYRTSLFSSKSVYIFDETHKLSNHAQTELLKPLEDVHLLNSVLIICCTTSVNGIIDTFLDRLVRLRTQLLSKQHSLDLINSVVLNEGIKISKGIKSLVIDKSYGNPRNILMNLYKVKDLKDEDEIRQILELSSVGEDGDIFKLFKVLTNGYTWTRIIPFLKSVLKTNDPTAIKIALCNITANKLMSQYLKGSEEGVKLLKLYDSLSTSNLKPLEKPDLIAALYKAHLIFK